MTQSQDYTSEDYTSRALGEAESSDALRADIERTRSSMSSTIDQIQDRVSPQNLRHEAQETVRSVVQDSADAVVGYVRDYAPEMGSTLFQAIKRNPIPAALIGLGAGWLLYDSLSNQSRGSNWRASGNYYDSGYGYADQYGNDRYGSRYNYSDFDPSGANYRSSSGGGVINQVRQQARDVASTVSDKVGQVTGAVSDAVGQVSDTVSDTVNQVADKAQHLGSQVGDQAQSFGSRASNLGSQAQRQAYQAGNQAQQLVESNPVSLGLAALAIGAAIGLALPATRRESQIMGQWRDQVVDKAQSVASDVKQRVQEVVEEVKPELQQVASMALDDVKQTGKAALAEAKDAVKNSSTINALKSSNQGGDQNDGENNEQNDQTDNQSGENSDQTWKQAQNSGQTNAS